MVPQPRQVAVRHRLLLGVAAVGVLLIALLGAAPALAQAPYWRLSSSAAPTNLPPGGEGEVIVTATNLGDAAASGAMTITDELPEGLTATAVSGSLASEKAEVLECKMLSAREVSCTDPNKPLAPSTGLRLTITVKVGEPLGTLTTLQNEIRASGGGAPAEAAREAVAIDGSAAPFGVEKYLLKPEQESGAADSQAGSHPFQLTTELALNQTAAEEPVALPKNLQFSLPPGLIGNPNATPQCSQANFNTIVEGVNLCGPETAVGVAEVSIDEPLIFETGPGTRTVPVFNLEPVPGEPARFGIVVLKVPVILDTAVRTGSDYGVVVTAKNTSQGAGLVSSKVTFWGVPGDPRHNASRGWECAGTGDPVLQSCKKQEEQAEAKQRAEKEKGEEPRPFLSLPTSCGTSLSAPMRAQSWVPGAEYLPERESEFTESLGGCNLLQFNPSISVEPETHDGSTPTGLTVGVKAPQPETAGGLAEAAVKATTVTLPEGVQLSPAAANGLSACSALEVGFNGLEHGFPEAAQTENDHFSSDPATCPDAAKVGTVKIKSPDLKNELTGFVYLAREHTNPFEAPLVIYLIARDPVSGVLVKLAGNVTPDPVTGRLVSTFENTPQVPFENLEVKFFAGDRASVSTPPLCGGYTTEASMAPWSGNPDATPSSSFSITSGPGGGSCSPSPQPFTPSLEAGSTNTQAGAFSPFTLTINRPDGDQALQGLTMHLPPGSAAMLSSVTPCPEPQAANNQCGPESLIGHSTASSGLGGEPFTLGGLVYLTTGYKGAPFGLSVVTPAVAGPFNLGDITVRSKIDVNPSTAAVTIESDPFPTIIKGVPVQLKQLNVTVDRAGFEFNPTNCSPMSISGAMTGSQGASVWVSYPFQVTNCAALPFKPTLTATTKGNSTKANGASLLVKVTSAPGQANISKTSLIFPIALPSRLTTIQKACLAAVFEANPAACDEGSNIGTAIVHTPVLKSPLSGPAYLVSHGGAAFPDVEFVLQGEGITLVLDGQTNIKKSITSSTFNAVPDAPVTTFETTLPEGPHSALTSNVAASKKYSLCGANLEMPTTITGQNGVVIKQETKIAVQGCAAVKAFKATRAQLLTKALKACRKQFKHNKKKRAKCEKQARKKYGPKKAAKKKSSKKKPKK
jgi:uncharacterized repeat protein (TIGR01451 family)